jgi:hypothetical protein
MINNDVMYNQCLNCEFRDRCKIKKSLNKVVGCIERIRLVIRGLI